jgi:hypothetical protein
MTKERENEIKQMSRTEQEKLLFQLRAKYSAQPKAPNQPVAMLDARELVAANEEIDLLEEFLRDSE